MKHKPAAGREIEAITKGIVFRDPPPIARQRSSKYGDEAVAEFLRKIAWRKGDWAVFRTGVTKQTAYVYASRYKKAFPHSEWVARKDKTGSKYTLYARVLYV